MTNPIQSLLSLPEKWRVRFSYPDNHSLTDALIYELQTTLTACQQCGDKSLGALLHRLLRENGPRSDTRQFDEMALQILLSANSRPVPSIEELQAIYDEGWRRGNVEDSNRKSAWTAIRNAILGASPPETPAAPTSFDSYWEGRVEALSCWPSSVAFSASEYERLVRHIKAEMSECWTAAQSQVQSEVQMWQARYNEKAAKMDSALFAAADAKKEAESARQERDKALDDLEAANRELAGLRWRSVSDRPTAEDANAEGNVAATNGSLLYWRRWHEWPWNGIMMHWHPMNNFPPNPDPFETWRKKFCPLMNDEGAREMYEAARL